MDLASLKLLDRRRRRHILFASRTRLAPHRAVKLPLRFARWYALPLALTVAACTDRPGASGDDQETGGTLVMALPGTGMSPTFPLFAADNMARMVSDQLFDRLAEIGPELGTVGDRGFAPRLAHRWEWSRDSMSIAFHLDPRARWHDGRPIRASDLRFTFDLMKDPKTATQLTPLVANIDSIRVSLSLTSSMCRQSDGSRRSAISASRTGPT